MRRYLDKAFFVLPSWLLSDQNPWLLLILWIPLPFVQQLTDLHTICTLSSSHLHLC